ncbi:polysaccharide deacetylase family protein [Alkalibacterium psychrotolerans]
MIKRLATTIKAIDKTINSHYLKSFKEENSLIVMMFHSLVKDQSEISLNHIDSSLAVTTEEFEEFIVYFLDKGYKFVAPNDIIEGLNKNQKHILITFDDGYYNNSNALPLLKKYDIPAVFFATVKNIQQNRSYWWDVLYRESLKRNVSAEQNLELIKKLKEKTTIEIISYLEEVYGKDSFIPLSDIDRPFTPDELLDFSQNKLVYIGNHTLNHAILTNYDLKSVSDQISIAQEEIKKFIGHYPNSIAYPNGNHSTEIRNICRKLNIDIGFTTRAHRNRIPVKNMLRLGRYSISSDSDISLQCERIRLESTPYRNFLKVYNRVCNFG